LMVRAVRVLFLRQKEKKQSVAGSSWEQLLMGLICLEEGVLVMSRFGGVIDRVSLELGSDPCWE